MSPTGRQFLRSIEPSSGSMEKTPARWRTVRMTTDRSTKILELPCNRPLATMQLLTSCEMHVVRWWKCANYQKFLWNDSNQYIFGDVFINGNWCLIFSSTINFYSRNYWCDFCWRVFFPPNLNGTVHSPNNCIFLCTKPKKKTFCNDFL